MLRRCLPFLSDKIISYPRVCMSTRICKNDQLGEYFVVITTSGWFLLGVYFSKQYSCCRFAKSNGIQALQTFQNNIEYWFVLQIVLREWNFITKVKFLDNSYLVSITYVRVSLTWVVLLARKFDRNYHLSKLSVKCERLYLPTLNDSANPALTRYGAQFDLIQ